MIRLNWTKGGGRDSRQYWTRSEGLVVRAWIDRNFVEAVLWWRRTWRSMEGFADERKPSARWVNVEPLVIQDHTLLSAPRRPNVASFRARARARARVRAV